MVLNLTALKKPKLNLTALGKPSIHTRFAEAEVAEAKFGLARAKEEATLLGVLRKPGEFVRALGGLVVETVSNASLARFIKSVKRDEPLVESFKNLLPAEDELLGLKKGLVKEVDGKLTLDKERFEKLASQVIDVMPIGMANRARGAAKTAKAEWEAQQILKKVKGLPKRLPPPKRPPTAVTKLDTTALKPVEITDVTPKGFGIETPTKIVKQKLERLKGETGDQAIARKVGYQIDNGLVKIESTPSGWKGIIVGSGTEPKQVLSGYFKKQDLLNEVFKKVYPEIDLTSKQLVKPTPPTNALKAEAKKFKTVDEFTDALIWGKLATKENIKIMQKFEEGFRKATKPAGARGDLEIAQDFYNKVKGVKEVVPKISKDLQPLTTEARKYKSADEFVEAQGKPLFHRTSAKFDKFSDEKKTKITGGFHFFDNKSISDQPSSVSRFGDKQITVYVKGKIANINTKNVNKFLRRNVSPLKTKQELKKRGFAGYKIGSETVIFDAENIKTKSQLTDIYNQATKKVSPEKKFPPKPEKALRPEEIARKPERGVVEPMKVVEPPDRLPKKPELDRDTSLVKEDNIRKNISQVEKAQLGIKKTPPEKALDETINHDGFFELPPETRWQAFRRNIEDFNIRLKILVKEIEKIAGKEVDETLDLWAQKDMLPRKQSDLIRRVRKEKQEFVKDLVAKDVKVEDFDKFLHAQHAIERNAKMNELRVARGKEPVEGLSGMTDAEATKIMSGATPDMKELSNKARKLIDEVLDFEVDQGMIKAKDAEIYREAYKNYVPLYRDLEDAVFTGIGQGISIIGKETKRAVGSTKRVTSPLGNIFYRKERSQIRALKNEVGKTIMDSVKEFPFLKDLFKVEKQKFSPRFNKEGELQWLDPKFKFGDNVIGAKIDGTQHFITIADPKVAQALKNLNLARVPKFIQHLRTALGIWSSFKTRWRPEFLITNFERDLGEAMINLGVEKGARKGLRREVVKNLFPSQKQIWKNLKGKADPVADEFFRLGGDTGHFWADNALAAEKSLIQIEKELTNQGIEKIKNPIRKVGEVIDNIQSVVELGVRFSTYKALIKRGVSKERAIQTTADLTINFSRQGEISPFLKSFYGFINPAIQGSSKVFRTVADRRGRSRIMASLTALATLGFMIRTMSIMMDKEGDEQISDWAKNHKLTFSIGNGRQITLWNMPYGYSTFYAMGSNMSEVMFGQKTMREAMIGVTETTVDSFSPFQTSLNSFIPTLAKPIFEINQNKNWYDGKIRPDQVFTKTPKGNFETYFNNTSQTAIFVSELLNSLSGGSEGKSGLIDVSPNDLEYGFNQFTGGPFEFVMSSVESGQRGMKGEFDENKTPFVRQFVRQGKPQSFSYKVIYDTLERAWKKNLSDLEKERFFRAVDIGLEEKVFDQDRADGFIRDYYKAQNQIQGTITDPENIKLINKMPAKDQERLIDTYATSTRNKLNKAVEETPTKLFPQKGKPIGQSTGLFKPK